MVKEKRQLSRRLNVGWREKLPPGSAILKRLYLFGGLAFSPHTDASFQEQ